ncbi:MAG TPA: BON domain-containing protein [Cyclobacteriaceae bacterium]|nr:BON domain-containing protein [Cyclobacteriaceae bacterium]
MKTNEEIRKDVMDEIKSNPELFGIATEIGVATKDGIVTLSGAVNSYRRKVAAEESAQKVRGVKIVASDIEVRIPGALKKTDTEIAEAVKQALRWNSAVDQDKIEVKVDDGWVYLSGVVNWVFEKDSAQRGIEWLSGIKGVINNIKLAAKKIDTKDLKTRISAAFHRNAAIDANALRIEVSDHTVTLRGTVGSWSEKNEAERVAWSYPGVEKVDNRIDIQVEMFA